MTSTSTSTREALYQSGLRRFAVEGWQAARVRDIVSDAGQANDSAINYHFGSRRGLLEAILIRAVARQEERRHRDLEQWESTPPGLPEIVRGVVSPLADLLDCEEGRDILRVIAQVGALAEVGDTVTADPVADTALQKQLEMLVAAAAQYSGQAAARHRVRQLIVMLTAELATRAADLAADPDSPAATLLGHCEYVIDLVNWLALGLARPVRRG